MSKTVGAGLLAHLASRSTTLATGLKITRTDGAIFTFTDHDQPFIFPAGSPLGLTYEAALGYTRTAVQTSAALNVDNLDLDGVLDSDSITDADLLAGLWDFAEIEIFIVNWADLTQGKIWMRRGHLGQITTSRGAFTAELRGLMQAAQQVIGRVYTPACNADLGDSRCQVNLATYTVTGTLTTVLDQARFTDTARAEAAGWFDGGLLTWTGGLNIGLRMEVKTFTYFGSPVGTPIITLQQPMPYTVAIGDTYSMYAGCDKTLATCRDKFNNVINFRGFPYFPGTDRMLTGT